MRKLLLIVSLCVFAFNVSAGDDFNRGWAKGWEQGYKHVKGSYAYPSYPHFLRSPHSTRIRSLADIILDFSWA